MLPTVLNTSRFRIECRYPVLWILNFVTNLDPDMDPALNIYSSFRTMILKAL
jgi:hypothetical protein